MHHGHAAIVKHLIAVAGANVNAASSNGNTPLHVAAVAGNAECAALLLLAGAQPRTVNRAGRTPQDMATADELRRLLQPPVRWRCATPRCPARP